MTRSKAIAEKAVEANARLAQPDSTNFPYSTWKYHKVRRGDNLSNIARKYGVSGSQIKELNQLKSNRLVVGIRLKIQRNPVHAVKPVQVDTLNQQTGGLVHVKNAADSLVLAESGSPKSTAPKNSSMQVDPTQQGEKQAKSYRVRQGDTLWSISRKFQGLTVEQLMKLNNLTSSSRLTPGMVLRIQLG
jgi:membrane-bound lytic murein transglycosylase D